MQKLILAIFCVVFISLAFGSTDNQSNSELEISPELFSQRDVLHVFNNTDRMRDRWHYNGLVGRNLYLEWSEQVAENSTTCNLQVGQEDAKQSSYIGNGGDSRTFKITVWRWDNNGQRAKFGDFRYTIWNDSGSGTGHEETTWITAEAGEGEITLYYHPPANEHGENNVPFAHIKPSDW